LNYEELDAPAAASLAMPEVANPSTVIEEVK